MLVRVQGIRAAPASRFLARAACSLLVTLAVAALAAPVAGARDPITPLSDVHRGLHCSALSVVQGTDIASFDVDVLDVVADDDGSGARILVRTSGPAIDGTGIAEGFSGSPVYCPDASGRIGNAGAISATVGQYGENVGLVTPIESMLGIQVRPPSSARSAPKLLRSAHALVAPLVLAGLSPPLAQLVRRAAARRHRSVIAVPAGPLGTFAPQPLVPGASMSAMLSSGAVAAGAIGTVTYRDGTTLYAFGHPLDSAGRRSLLLGDAYVFTVVGNPLDTEDATSYKLAAPGHVLGTLSSDALDGVAGSVGPPPRAIPVTVTVRDRDRHRTVRQRTDVADETDVGNPSGASALAQVAPLAIAQAVSTAFDGAPANETGQLCFTMRLREARRPVHFCKRYVVNGAISPDDPPPLAVAMGTDVGTAVSEIDLARFARLHVTSLSAGITIERGLRLATIVGARGPRSVRPGHTAALALRVRVVRGPLRTIRLRIAIPADAAAGTHTLRLTGTQLQSVDSSDGSGGGLLAALLGSDSGPSPGQSLGDLVDTIGALAGYDGVQARLGGDHWPAYRDGRMRLDGDATLVVRVAGRTERAGSRRAR